MGKRLVSFKPYIGLETIRSRADVLEQMREALFKRTAEAKETCYAEVAFG